MSRQRINDSSDLEDLYTPSPKRIRENIIIPPEYNSLMSVSCYLQSPTHVSALLEVSKTTEASDADNSFNSTDFLSKEIDKALNAKELLNKNLIDEINEYKCLLKEVASARNRCKASKFVVETMKEMFSASTELPSNLKKKCSQHLRYCTFLKNFKNSELLDVAGIDNILSPISLTDDEKQSLNLEIQKALEEKLFTRNGDAAADCSFEDLLKNFTRNAVMPGSTLAEESARAISLISETNKAVDTCFEKTFSIIDAFNQIWNYRVQRFENFYKEEMIRLINWIKLIELEFKNLNLQIENSMVNENDDIEKALDVLLRKLKSILEENEFSLQKTEAIKEAYDELKDTRFEEILKEYLELREHMKHKQWALKQIQKPKPE